MFTRWIFLCFLLGYSFQGFTQQFPNLTGNRFDESRVEFPRNTKKYTVLLITFGKKGTESASTWIDPLVQKFIRKSGMLDAFFDADLYALTMVNAAEWNIIRSQESKIKSEIPSEIINNVLYSTSDCTPLLSVLGENAKSTSTLILLNNEGKIVKQIQGEFSEKKMEALEDGFE